jgi:hypothetical protein
MDENVRSHCVLHLREAIACLESIEHSIIAARLQDILETVEQESCRDDVAATGSKL